MMAHQSRPYPTFLGWLPVITDEGGKVLHTGPCFYATIEGAHAYSKTRIRGRTLINEAYDDLRERRARKGGIMEIAFGLAVAGAMALSLGFGLRVLRALSVRLDRDLGARHPGIPPGPQKEE
jgi:hypothetical protein